MLSDYCGIHIFRITETLRGDGIADMQVIRMNRYRIMLTNKITMHAIEYTSIAGVYIIVGTVHTHSDQVINTGIIKKCFYLFKFLHRQVL